MKKFVFSLMMFGFLFLGISNENVSAQSSKLPSTRYHFWINNNFLPPYYNLPDFWIKMTWIPPQGSNETGFSVTHTFTYCPVNEIPNFGFFMGWHDDGRIVVESNLFDVLPFSVSEKYLPLPFTPKKELSKDLGIILRNNTSVSM